MIDTKASWKRRALKAEIELEMIRRVRVFEHTSERELCRVNAAQSAAIIEILEAISNLKNMTNISYRYELEKADCLNGEAHKYKELRQYGRQGLPTLFRCIDCGHETTPAVS